MWDAVDLAQETTGTGYLPTLKQMAAEYAVPWKDFSPAERAQYKRAAEKAQDLARDVADFAHGLSLYSEQRKRNAVLALRWAWANGLESTAGFFEEMLELIPKTALNPTTADPDTLVRTFLRVKASNAEAAEAVLQLGREDREHAERVTKAIVYMLTSADQQIGLCA